ncbi:hypothetical protein VPH35_088597 [Triticum aestivum]
MPSVAPRPSYDPWNKFKLFVETRPGPSQFSFSSEISSSMTQMTPISHCMSGYSIQSTAASTTQTKFTSLRPLPPSVVSSHVYSSEAARPHGYTTFRPLVPLPCEPGKCNAPGDVIFIDKGSMKQAPIASRSNTEILKQISKSFKRPAKKDDVLLSLPKKPCVAGKDINQSVATPGRSLWIQTRWTTLRYLPVRLNKPKIKLQAVGSDASTVRIGRFC